LEFKNPATDVPKLYKNQDFKLSAITIIESIKFLFFAYIFQRCFVKDFLKNVFEIIF